MKQFYVSIFFIFSMVSIAFNPTELAQKTCESLGDIVKLKELSSQQFNPAQVVTAYSQLGECVANEVIFSEEHIFIMRAKFTALERPAELFLSLDKSKKIKSFIGLPQAFTPFNVEEEKLSMRDGVTLHTYIMKHSGEARGTIYHRSPYSVGNNILAQMKMVYFSMGYNVVFQVMRGTYLSEGEFVWLSPQEAEDAYDTIDWIIQQDFSNGKVGTVGVSYDGFGALAAGIDAHPALKVIVSVSSPTNILTDSLSAGGILEEGMLKYLLDKRSDADPQLITKQIRTMIANKIPALEMDNKILGENLAAWDGLVRAVSATEEFDFVNGIFDRLVDISTPTFHVAGNKSDQDSRDTILAFEEIEKNSMFKDQHFLVIGDWGHGLNPQVFPYFLAPIFQKYLEDNDEIPNFSRYTRFSEKLEVIEASDSYVNRVEKIFEFPFDITNQVGVDPGTANGRPAGRYVFAPTATEFFLVHGLVYQKTLAQDITTDGAGIIDLSFMFSGCKMDVSVYYWKLNAQGVPEILSIPRLRERVYNTGEVINTQIKMYAEKRTLKAGESIYFTVSEARGNTVIPIIETMSDPACGVNLPIELMMDHSQDNGAKLPIR